MKTKFAILGAGSFGIAMAKLIASNKNFEVTLWSALNDEINELIMNGENKKYLPGVKLSKSEVNLTTNLHEISNSDFIIFAVASSFVRTIARTIKNFLPTNCIIVNLAKGLEETSYKRMSEVISDEIGCENNLVVLSGPSHAEEIAKFVPTTVVAASKNLKAAEIFQKTLSSSIFRIYINNDIIGVELGGALKNILALAIGICDGLRLGENSKAALMTRGIVEIVRLGVALGAKPQTFSGLSGLGDLIATCTSLHSRNRKAGILIGQGKEIETALKEVGMVVEGFNATKVAFNLSQNLKINMPIVKELFKILYKGEDVKKAVNELMNRPVKNENELEKLYF